MSLTDFLWQTNFYYHGQYYAFTFFNALQRLQAMSLLLSTKVSTFMLLFLQDFISFSPLLSLDYGHSRESRR